MAEQSLNGKELATVYFGGVVTSCRAVHSWKSLEFKTKFGNSAISLNFVMVVFPLNFVPTVLPECLADCPANGAHESGDVTFGGCDALVAEDMLHHREAHALRCEDGGTRATRRVHGDVFADM